MAPRKGTYHGPHKAWTADEDATVRALYAETPRKGLRAALTSALPHRAWGSIVARAAKLEVPRVGCAWSAEEDAALRACWGGEAPAKILRRLPGRPWRAVLRRVAALRLDVIPTGFVTLAEAARKIGYARGTLLAICRRARVPTMRWWGARAKGPAKRGAGRTQAGRVCRWLLVDLVLATVAAEAEVARGETVYAGARARDVEPSALRRELLRMGAMNVGRRGVRVLLPAEVLDRAAETVAARGRGARRAA